jgi:predicted dehydrogenase
MPPGFPFFAGFRALFERASFDQRAVFDGDGPPKSIFTIFSDKARGVPVQVPSRDPYQVELRRFTDCIQGKADAAFMDVERATEALVLSVATQQSLAESRSITIG